MGDEQNRLDRVERAQRELQEQLAKSQEQSARSQEESREQMTKLMELVSAAIKGKGYTENLATKERSEAQKARNEVVMLDGQSHQNTVNPVNIPNLGDPAEQEKLKMVVLNEAESADSQRKYQLLEERLRVVENTDVFGSVDASERCLVPDLVIPPKFRVPDFGKYDGTTDPSAHITMFCRKMTGHTDNDKLLIHYFQDSLSGSGIRWYNQLSRDQIRSWNDLARAFLSQYKHVTDMAPDRLTLQNMEKKATESFKEYAQRWMDMATQVRPPLTQKEITVLFVNTLQAPYYDRLVGNATKNFADMVTSGEMIENAIKNGKLEGDKTSNAERNEAPEKKEEHVQAVGEFTPYPQFPPYQSYYSTNASPSHYPYLSNIHPQTPNPMSAPATKPASQKRPRGNQEKFLIPIPELLPLLIRNQYLTPVPLKTAPNPSARSYDPNSKCEYHMGAIGHSTEKCRQLKENIEGLVHDDILTQELIEQWKSASP